MKTCMRLWLSGVLVFCLSAHGFIRPGYGQDSPINKQIESLKDDDRNIRAEAINGLVKLGPDAVRPLISALKSENENLRREAVFVLGRIKDADAVDALIAALKDKDSIVGYRATVALKEIGDPRAIDPLISALKDKDSLVSYGAAEALGTIGDRCSERYKPVAPNPGCRRTSAAGSNRC
jgi:HEAT repeat protein